MIKLWFYAALDLATFRNPNAKIARQIVRVHSQVGQHLPSVHIGAVATVAYALCRGAVKIQAVKLVD